FDLEQIDSALDKSGKIPGRGVIKNIDVVSAESRTRLVMNLSKTVTYETSVEGNHLLISLRNNEIPGRTSTRPPGSTRGETMSLCDIDFHRGTQGEGRVEVELSQPGAVVNVHSHGSRLLVEFMKAYLPPNLERRLNVLDFATPVQSVETVARD